MLLLPHTGGWDGNIRVWFPLFPNPSVVPGCVGTHGWPYVPAGWTGRCTWRWSYLPVQVWKTLPKLLSNWDAYYAHNAHVKRIPWWFYPLAISLPVAGDIVVETQVTALAAHIAQTLNQTGAALSLLTNEVDQIRKVVLQNQMTLVILTAARGRTRVILHTPCCVYSLDTKKNITQVLEGLNQEIQAIQQLTGDSLLPLHNMAMGPRCP